MLKHITFLKKIAQAGGSRLGVQAARNGVCENHSLSYRSPSALTAWIFCFSQIAACTTNDTMNSSGTTEISQPSGDVCEALNQKISDECGERPASASGQLRYSRCASDIRFNEYQRLATLLIEGLGQTNSQSDQSSDDVASIQQRAEALQACSDSAETSRASAPAEDGQSEGNAFVGEYTLTFSDSLFGDETTTCTVFLNQDYSFDANGCDYGFIDNYDRWTATEEVIALYRNFFGPDFDPLEFKRKGDSWEEEKPFDDGAILTKK
ncbi:MAG: hypothetical protein AAF850_02950 [Pseudomonadota bacterium]